MAQGASAIPSPSRPMASTGRARPLPLLLRVIHASSKAVSNEAHLSRRTCNARVSPSVPSARDRNRDIGAADQLESLFARQLEQITARLARGPAPESPARPLAAPRPFEIPLALH